MTRTDRAWSRSLARGAALLVLSWSATAAAEQVVVFDQSWDHTADLPDSHFRMPPAAETPADWTAPVDYTQGSAWVHLEVHTKPTEQETKFQVCFEATPTYACTAQSPTYTEVGIYEWETPFAAFWSPPGELVDWTQGTNDIACILKDTMNGKPSADNVGRETAALYMPTQVRLVVTLVEAGSVYEPPTAGGETSSGGESGVDETATSDGAGDETRGSSTSAAGEDEAATTPDDGPSDDDATVSASAGMPTTSGTDTTDGGGGTQDDDANGCSCRAAAPGPGATVSWIALFAIVGRRRAVRRA